MPGRTLISSVLLCIFSCSDIQNKTLPALEPAVTTPVSTARKNADSIRCIQVTVALCDNRYQGIVRVPAQIGNGQDPAKNLYWGAAYGIKNYFKNKKDWMLLKEISCKNPAILERCLFKHRSLPVYLLADAWDGKYIKEATEEFLNGVSGKGSTEVKSQDRSIFFGGSADLHAYIGHNGLMDFSLEEPDKQTTPSGKDVIILACYSKPYFAPFLKALGAQPLLWTTGLMAPEAYTLHDALAKWVNRDSNEQIRLAGASAYARYQHCSLNAAKRLLQSGF